MSCTLVVFPQNFQKCLSLFLTNPKIYIVTPKIENIYFWQEGVKNRVYKLVTQTLLLNNNVKTRDPIRSNQLEKLEAAKTAYLWLRLDTFGYLWLPHCRLFGLVVDFSWIRS